MGRVPSCCGGWASLAGGPVSVLETGLEDGTEAVDEGLVVGNRGTVAATGANKGLAKGSGPGKASETGGGRRGVAVAAAEVGAEEGRDKCLEGPRAAVMEGCPDEALLHTGTVLITNRATRNSSLEASAV